MRRADFGESGAADQSRLSVAWHQDRGRLGPLLIPKPDSSESTILGNVTYCVTSPSDGRTRERVRNEPLHGGWRLVAGAAVERIATVLVVVELAAGIGRARTPGCCCPQSFGTRLRELLILAYWTDVRW